MAKQNSNVEAPTPKVFQKQISFLLEAGAYFEKLPSNGEDRTHWANAFNAKNCREIAELLSDAAIADTKPQISIVAAAIRVSLNGAFISLPPPARHHDIIEFLHEKFGYHVNNPDDQGFVDSMGVFRERRQARVIAGDAGQITSPECGLYLYSENLW